MIIFDQKFIISWLERCCFVSIKTDHSFLQQDIEIAHLISAATTTQLALVCCSCNWYNLKHAHTS